jgi:hypothetical protein
LFLETHKDGGVPPSLSFCQPGLFSRTFSEQHEISQLRGSRILFIFHESPSGFAFRNRVIKGVIAGAVATSSAAYLFRSSSVFGQQPPGMGERLITLNVNGQQRRVDVMKQETLAWTLRYKLGLPAPSSAVTAPSVAPAQYCLTMCPTTHALS